MAASDKNFSSSAGNINKSVGAARDTMDTLLEISNLLNTGLDSETLSICVKLCEAGVNPEALAAVIKELKRESLALQEAERS